MAYNYIPHNVNGTFRNSKPYVKIGTSWRECEEAYVNRSGSWIKAFKNIIEHASYGTRNNANIAADFGYPSEAGDYIWTNNGDCRSAGGNYGVITGGFPAGSTLTIINNGYIRGRGGNGNTYTGAPGQTALYIQFPTALYNASGYIFGGGGGGGGASNVLGKRSNKYSGGGGAGSNPGYGYANGTLTSGGAGEYSSASQGGRGGNCGANGSYGGGSYDKYPGGAGGRAIQKNGQWVGIYSGNDTNRIRGAVS